MYGDAIYVALWFRAMKLEKGVELVIAQRLQELKKKGCATAPRYQGTIGINIGINDVPNGVVS